MTVLLVRHASAGDRSAWSGDDALRPLDGKGRRQAAALARRLAGYGVERVLTSPAVRCRQTVEPLAGALGLPVEEREELAEGAGAGGVLALVRELAGAPAALCTHGDVVARVAGDETRTGSTLVLGPDGDGGLRRLEYLLPEP